MLFVSFFTLFAFFFGQSFAVVMMMTVTVSMSMTMTVVMSVSVVVTVNMSMAVTMTVVVTMSVINVTIVVMTFLGDNQRKMFDKMFAPTLSEEIREFKNLKKAYLSLQLQFSILRLIINMSNLCKLRHRKKVLENFQKFISQ